MKIAILTTCYFPEYNGASIRTDGIAQGLAALGHEVYIVVPGKSLEREVSKHAVIWHIPVSRNFFSAIVEKFTKFHPARYFSLLKHLQHIIRVEGIQIVHTRQPLDLFYAGYTLRKKGSFFWAVEAHKLLSITDYENGNMSALRKKLVLSKERRLMNASDLIVTMTPSGKSTLQTKGIKQHMIAVPNASSLQQQKTTSPFPKKRYLFYAGNLREVEGIDQLLKAFKIIHEEFKDILCVIAGGGAVKKWQQYAKKLQLDNSVLFLGELSYKKLAHYYQHATVFVHPRKEVTYHKDIIGLKFYDALKAGLPIITSDVGEMSTVIKKNNVGLIAKERDEVDFAQKVMVVLRDIKVLAKMKKNASRLGKQSTWKASCKELSQAYNNARGKNHA